MYIPSVNERQPVDFKKIWPYSLDGLYRFSHAQINKFVREETLKADAILAGDGDRLNELLEEAPLEYYDCGDYTYESSVCRGGVGVVIHVPEWGTWMHMHTYQRRGHRSPPVGAATIVHGSLY